MQAVSVLESNLAAISSDRASEGGEGPVVDSLPYEHEALVDVGEVVVEDVEGVADEGAGGFGEHRIVVLLVKDNGSMCLRAYWALQDISAEV